MQIKQNLPDYLSIDMSWLKYYMEKPLLPEYDQSV